MCIKQRKTYILQRYTICQGSSDPFYTVSFYIKWVTTSWTHSIYTIQGLILFKRIPNGSSLFCPLGCTWTVCHYRRKSFPLVTTFSMYKPKYDNKLFSNFYKPLFQTKMLQYEKTTFQNDYENIHFLFLKFSLYFSILKWRPKKMKRLHSI